MYQNSSIEHYGSVVGKMDSNRNLDSTSLGYPEESMNRLTQLEQHVSHLAQHNPMMSFIILE